MSPEEILRLFEALRDATANVRRSELRIGFIAHTVYRRRLWMDWPDANRIVTNYGSFREWCARAVTGVSRCKVARLRVNAERMLAVGATEGTELHEHALRQGTVCIRHMRLLAGDNDERFVELLRGDWSERRLAAQRRREAPPQVTEIPTLGPFLRESYLFYVVKITRTMDGRVGYLDANGDMTRGADRISARQFTHQSDAAVAADGVRLDGSASATVMRVTVATEELTHYRVLPRAG